ncbi:hypothetical protein J1N35_008509 [Gossypium stocksii]|uniref:Uncharacterized protein n=1 Tax=Gossypium stocksii TaxID=47602 RepID=A0A9D3W8K0_9ROSI|nr:hypothetical protein J1N35_008509 [Gossypium stocksii]
MGRHSSIFGTDLNFDDHYQSSADFVRHMGYRRIDNLLLTIRSDESTSNPLFEDENESVDEEEGVANAVDGSESNPDPIWQSSPNGSEVALFSKQEHVQFESEPCGSDNNGLDNAPDLRSTIQNI